MTLDIKKWWPRSPRVDPGKKDPTEHTWPPIGDVSGATAVLEQLTLTGTSTRRGKNIHQKTGGKNGICSYLMDKHLVSMQKTSLLFFFV